VISKLESSGASAELASAKERLKVLENLELELAFYKAEKQRNEVTIEYQEKSTKELRATVKAQKVEVATEKEKVRRLSTQIEASDIAALNGEAWREEMAQLKQQLTQEQMQKMMLQKEKKELQKRLSNVQSTQVNQLLQYTTPRVAGDSSISPPPPPSYNNARVQEANNQRAQPGDDEDDEEDDSDASELSGDDGENEEGLQLAEPHEVDEVEALKFKLAHAELQNAQLKRRVSIAGIEKETLSLLWDHPRVTIQMVSEFIERLPVKHKEKIWSRHATGQYIAKNKILHTLHSFVALCIKIKDRTAVAPSRQGIEKKLVPFADVIRQRTDNANGMSLEEFNTELHFWILEPVSGLIMTTDEQKQWMDEIDALREELVKAQKEKMRIQRKSQMDLTVLLDKMKGLEETPAEQIESLEEQIQDLHGIINTCQEEAKQREEDMLRLQHENDHLRETAAGKTRESEDEADEEEEDEDNEEEEEVLLVEDDNELIEENQKMSLNEFRCMQHETQFVEERMEFSVNDTMVSKQSGWKKKAIEAQQCISILEQEKETIEKARRQSVAELHTLREAMGVQANEIEKVRRASVAEVTALKEAMQSKSEEISQYNSQMESAKKEIERFRNKHQESERVRKHSISTLHDNLFAKLLEAEAEHEEMVQQYKEQIERLEGENASMATKKVDMVIRLDETVDTLRKSLKDQAKNVRMLKVQVSALKRKNERLEARSVMDTFKKSWLG